MLRLRATLVFFLLAILPTSVVYPLSKASYVLRLSSVLQPPTFAAAQNRTRHTRIPRRWASAFFGPPFFVLWGGGASSLLGACALTGLCRACSSPVGGCGGTTFAISVAVSRSLLAACVWVGLLHGTPH